MLGLLVLLDHQVQQDQQDRQDQLGLQELMVPQVQWDLLGLLDPRGLLEIRETKAL